MSKTIRNIIYLVVLVVSIGLVVVGQKNIGLPGIGFMLLGLAGLLILLYSYNKQYQ